MLAIYSGGLHCSNTNGVFNMTANQTTTITSINAAVAAYVAAFKQGRKAIADMAEAIKGSDLPFTRKDLAQPLMESVAAAYGVTLIAKERGTGNTWDLEGKQAKESNAAKQCHKEMLGKLFADAEEQAPAKDKVVISAEARALLVQLDALYETYPEMRAVCNAYIAKAQAK
jgi:hypothetical protein